MSATTTTDARTAAIPPRRGRPPLPTAQRRSHRIVIHLDNARAQQLSAIAGPDCPPGRAAYDLLVSFLEDTAALPGRPADPRPDGGAVDPNRTEQGS